jgi:antitoxin (DNA-binding transcriptional repressor) of toxin-antitoxin stability system
MMTVGIDVIAADLPAFIDKIATGETLVIASDRRPVAELQPPSHAAGGIHDGTELARRRQLGREIDGLRAKIRRRTGVQPDSTPMIRAMRDNE